MADPIRLQAAQFLAACQNARPVLCVDLLEAEQHKGKPRVVFSGLVKVDGAWIFSDGLCLVSAEVYTALGGDPNA